MWRCKQGHGLGFTGLDAPACLRCGGRLFPPIRPPAEGFDQFDHTFTSAQARVVLATIPEDSYHWADIERIGQGRVVEYTRLMAEGRWVDQTIARGYQDHPVRWNRDGELTHGAIRLIACEASGRPFRTAVVAPSGLLQEMFHAPSRPSDPARVPGVRHRSEAAAVGDPGT